MGQINVKREDKSIQYAVLFIATFGAVLAPFMGSSVNVALPAIRAEFNIDAVTLAWIATSYTLASAAFLLPFGRLADIYGRKKVYLIGTIVVGLSSLFCGLSNSIVPLLIFRITQGIGSAMMFSTSVPILISAFKPEERGKVLGINGAAIYIGLSIGPIVGGWLTSSSIGWRGIFHIIVYVCVAIILAVVFKLEENIPAMEGDTFRAIDSFLYIAALIAVIYGFSSLPETQGFIFISIGIIGFIVFSKVQMRVNSPLLDIKLFKGNTIFVLSTLATMISHVATFSISFYMSLYLQYILNYSPSAAGFVLIVQPVIQAIFSPIAGRVSDKIDPRKVASAGMGVIVVGVFMLVFIGNQTSITYIYLALALLGLGFALFASPNMNAIMSSVTQKNYGIASAILGTARTTGQAFSMGIVTMVFALNIGNSAITPELYDKFIESGTVIYVIMTVLCVLGIFASLSRTRNKKVLSSSSALVD